jgi:hypothetical protein
MRSERLLSSTLRKIKASLLTFHKLYSIFTRHEVIIMNSNLFLNLDYLHITSHLQIIAFLIFYCLC